MATINGPDIAVGDQLAFKLAGTSLSLHRKPAGSSSWTQILAATDTTISGPGRLGLEFYNASGAKADDWTISPDLPGGTPSVPVNTGLPTVSGTAQVGQTLTGTVGSWTGATSFAQQWQRCSGATCNPIANATNLTYVPIAADVGFTLRLQVTGQQHRRPQPARQLGPNRGRHRRHRHGAGQHWFADRHGYGPGGADVDRHGRLLDRRQQLQPAVAALQGATCNPIGNATSLTYQPVTADVGFTLRLQVTASNTAGPSLPANSAATAAVIAATGTVPVNTGLPTVTGTAQVGQTLTGTVGSWTGASSYSQQWQRCTRCDLQPDQQRHRVDLCAGRGRCRLHPAAPGHRQQQQPAPACPPTPTRPLPWSRPAGGGTVTDSFTRADASTLGTGWSTTNWVGASSCLLAISANQAAYPAGKSGGCDQYWTADNLADTVGSFTATALPPEGGEIDIGGRIQNGGSSQAVLYEGAWLRHTTGPDTFYIVRRSSNGSWTTIATINGPDIAVGDQLAFKLQGTNLSLHRKPAGTSSWTQILAASDTTISGPGRLGLELYNASGAKADDWTISPDLPSSGSGSVPVNTALPTVSGTAQVGQTLSGTVGSWTGASSYSQQWQRCSGATCNPIGNATGLTYVPVTADVGFTLRLQVTASNTTGPSLPANSAATAAVIAATGTVPLNTALPTVTGTAQVGQTLTGTVGSWTGASSYSQQWQRCTGATCNPIGNATASPIVPVAADVGFTLRLQVTASNTAGPSLPANSAATAAVIAATGTVPVNTGLPTVTGTAQVGQTLTGTVGSWTGATSYSQQWQRCSGATCNPISNATASPMCRSRPTSASPCGSRSPPATPPAPSLPANSAQTAVVAAAAGGGSGVTDSFTRADALTLGTGWSTTNWLGASSCLLAISANQAAYPAGKSGGCHQYWTADNLADTVASFTATALPPEGGEIDIGGRIQNGGSSQAVLYEGAWLRHTAGPDTFYIVRRSSNGNWTTIATINGPDIAVGDQLAFKLAGTNLSLHRKPAGTSSWTQILAATDTTITGPGRLGLELYNASGAKADDWTISPDLP